MWGLLGHALQDLVVVDAFAELDFSQDWKRPEYLHQFIKGNEWPIDMINNLKNLIVSQLVDVEYFFEVVWLIHQLVDLAVLPDMNDCTEPNCHTVDHFVFGCYS